MARLPLKPRTGMRDYVLQAVAEHFLFHGKHYDHSTKAVVGDLVFMTCAGISEQWLAWVEAIWPGTHGDTTYALRGVGLTEIVNWTNIGLVVIDRKFVAGQTRFKWTDEMQLWTRKLWRVAQRTDMHGCRYADPTFLGDDVFLDFRSRWSDVGAPVTIITFPAWKKMKTAEMKMRLEEGSVIQEAKWLAWKAVENAAREARKAHDAIMEKLNALPPVRLPDRRDLPGYVSPFNNMLNFKHWPDSRPPLRRDVRPISEFFRAGKPS